MNELKLKMAVDARRKWLPREKVMPGKPGGDDGDAHTSEPIREQSARQCPSSGPEQPCHPWVSAGYNKGNDCTCHITLRVDWHQIFLFFFFKYEAFISEQHKIKNGSCMSSN